ncbi:MAG: hypothetical protein ACRCT6_11435 [Notoacmeibacter sp.]
MNHEWKVGDKAFIDDNAYSSKRPMKLVTVEKVTATQVTAVARRFVTLSGREVGGSSYSWASIRPATDDLIASEAAKRKRHDAEVALKRIAEHMLGQRGDDAVALMASLPNSVKALAGERT